MESHGVPGLSKKVASEYGKIQGKQSPAFDFIMLVPDLFGFSRKSGDGLAPQYVFLGSGRIRHLYRLRNALRVAEGAWDL